MNALSRRGLFGALLVLVFVSCASGDRSGPTAAEARHALGRVQAVQAAFGSVPPASRRRADVVLPKHANEAARIADRATGIAIHFRLENASASPATRVDEYSTVYTGAIGGADVIHRVHSAGTEDYVAFDTRPERESLSYEVDVSRVYGVRWIENTLEFLDSKGSPALRVASPYVIDANRVRHAAKLAVSGCEAQRNNGAPWDGVVTSPGSDRCIIHISWSDVAYPAIVDPAWGTTGTLAHGRMAHTSTTLPSGRVLIAGGYTPPYYSVAECEIFDETAAGGSGAFVASGSLQAPHVRGKRAVLMADGKVLITGGGYSGASKGSEIFDPAAGGGAGASTLTADMLKPRESHTMTRLPSGKVLVAGGGGVGPSLAESITAELFDPATKTYSATGNLVDILRMMHSASLLSTGKVLIAGGYGNGEGSLSSTELYDPATGKFTAGPAMLVVRYNHTATTLPSGKVLILGGWGNGYVSNADLYTPSPTGIGAFAKTGSLAEGRTTPATALLPSGKVLTAGGDNGGAAAFADLWDPAADAGKGAWTSTVALPAGRYGHAASTLPSGKVLISGGYPTYTEGLLYGAKLGDACTTAGSCLSNHCVDGRCCDTACDVGSCDRCDVPGKEGTCSPAPVKSDGAPSCSPFACDGVSSTCPTTCLDDGACAPQFFCAKDGTCQARKEAGASCDPAANCKDAGCNECAQNACVDGFCCDQPCNGKCQACSAALKQSNQDDGKCGPTKDGIDPRNECEASGEVCKADGQCNGTGDCRLATPAGVACGAAECQGEHGTIARGKLCTGQGVCQDNAQGVDCSPFVCKDGGCTTSCTAASDCANGSYCSGGVCVVKKPGGLACSTSEECATGHCVDGFCCNVACDGQCEACDVEKAEGTCTPVSGNPHGRRAACAGGDGKNPCAAASCDGSEPKSCAGFAGAKVACGAATCDGNTALAPGICNGKGTCRAPDPVPCGSFVCRDAACLTSCSADTDCVTGNTCDVASHRCVAGASCDGDHTTTGANGQKTDCTPYRCQPSGVCATRCQSVDDCLAPLVCDPNGSCIAPPSTVMNGDGGGSSGCMSTPHRSPGPSLFALGLLACLGARRRFRAGPRHR